MDVRIPILIIVILLGFILDVMAKMPGNSHSDYRRFYVISVMTIFLLDSALRGMSVGDDTERYFEFFRKSFDRPWDDIFNSFYTAFFEGDDADRDPGFGLFVKIFQIFFGDFTLFLIFVGFLFFIPLGIILYKHTQSIIQLTFAFVLYVALFRIVGLSGIRQQVATGFTFISFLYFTKDKYVKGVIFILIAATVHITAIIFILLPILKLLLLKLIKVIHLITLLLVPIIIQFSGILVLLLASFMKNDYYSAYGERASSNAGYTYVFLITLVSLACFVFIKRSDIESSSRSSLLYCTLPLTTLFAPLITQDESMIRLGQYFSLFLMVMIPKAVELIPIKGTKKIVYWVGIVTLMYLSLRSPFPYEFVWESPMK